MPTFDPANPKSADAATLVKTAELIAKAPVFWELVEATQATEQERIDYSLTKIVIGVNAEAWSDGEFSIPQLAQMHCEAHLYPPTDPQSITYQSDGSPIPEEGGTIHLFIRRYVRPMEVDNYPKRNNLFLWFYDCVSALRKYIVQQAEVDLCPRITQINPLLDAAFNVTEQQTAQGEYLHALLELQWGDEQQD